MRNALIAFSAAALSTAALVALVAACSNDKSTSDGGADSGFVGCKEAKLEPGAFPDPSCDPALIDYACAPGAGKCAIDEAKCGSASTCLPLASNKGKSILDFRLRKLNVVAPSGLRGLQTIVIDKGILLKGVCGENQDGTFSWLLRVDKAAGTITTGGAPPGDPFSAYCFYRDTINGLPIAPVTVKATFNGNTFSTETLSALNIPIFILGNPVPVILPVRGAKIQNTTIEGDDCIGAFNKDALDSKCETLDFSSCPRWKPAGSLGGYITLDDADKVDIRESGRTLCSQLTGDTAGGEVDIGMGVLIKHCAHEGGDMKKPVLAKGDYCGATQKSGDCRDSYWLAATFAASGVKIEEPSTNPMCKSGAGGDGGVSDASTD